MFTLPSLPYHYHELEPHIDALTMEIHHTKHHQAYITQLNAALESYPHLKNASLETLIQDMHTYDEPLKTAVANHGGGHYNHSLFWTLLSPQGGGTPTGILAQAIATTWGDFDTFKNAFNEASKKVFGSGWAWLSLDKDGTLIIHSTINQHNPLMVGQFPLMGLDVWEHAYYLRYQNKRPDYINAWWNLINWKVIEDRYIHGSRVNNK